MGSRSDQPKRPVGASVGIRHPALMKAGAYREVAMQKYPRRTVGRPLTYPRKDRFSPAIPLVADRQTPHGMLRILDVAKGLTQIEYTDPCPRPIQLRGKYRR